MANHNTLNSAQSSFHRTPDNIMTRKHGNDTKTPPEEEHLDDLTLAKTNLQGDWMNVFLLLLLYTMQSLPLGLSSAIPILLQNNKHSTFKDQALFSLSGWPFSLKLLWAPLVDAIYVQKLGRRKSWLIPVQYLIGAIILYAGSDIDNLLPETEPPKIGILVYVFFALNFLAATQDIAVDGWALTMLKKNNVGYASTCNSTGQAIGSMIGSMVPILFTSEDFCNRYLRSTPGVGGVVTMKNLLYGLGIIFMLTTTLIAVLKKEKDSTLDDDHVKFGVLQYYALLWNMLKIPSIRLLIMAMLTAKIGFAATDNVSTLKLMSAGVSKDNLMVIGTALSGLIMIVPLIVAKFTSGPKSMSVYLKIIPIRLTWNILYAFLVYYTPRMIKTNGIIDVPVYYYVILVFLILTHQVLVYIMFVAIMAFYSRISDSRSGGTYMTLLNTVTNLGSTWAGTVALALMDSLTSKSCTFNSENNCSTPDFIETCKAHGGDCDTTIDGYYVETAVCTVMGIAWFVYFRKTLKNLQTKSCSHWLVNMKKMNTDNHKTSHSMTVIE